jgi:hypothetical protein
MRLVSMLYVMPAAATTRREWILRNWRDRRQDAAQGRGRPIADDLRRWARSYLLTPTMGDPR